AVLPPLVALADFAGIMSGYLVGLVAVDGLTTAEFIYGARFYFRPWALYFSVIKAAFFGLAITFLACYIGLEGGRGGAVGGGRTTTAAVVGTARVLMFLAMMVAPLVKMW